MGYTTVSTSMFHPDMQQTPENVAKVLDIAGWNANEAAYAAGIHHARVHFALYGAGKLADVEWQKLLDVAGRRAFDYEGESE